MAISRERRDRCARQRRQIRLEFLETRALLTTAESFAGPSLSGLIQQAENGKDTAPAAISLMEGALAANLISGPLADLDSGAVDGDGFVAEVRGLESSYEQDLAQQLSPDFPHVNEILDIEGEKFVADVIALNQQESVGLISSSALATDSRTAIDTLVGGPINALNTSLSGYKTVTDDFVSDLDTLAQSLGSSASPSLTPAQVGATAMAETQAYQTNMHAGLEVLHPGVSNEVDAAVSTLETAEMGIAQDSGTAAQGALNAAVSAFDSALLGSGGIFVSGGAVSRAISRGDFAPNETEPQDGTTLSVSGTDTQGSPATLTATLTSPATGQGVPDVTVDFTLDGAFVGAAVTDSSGVATLTGVTTSDAIGTDTGGVFASFAGDIAFVPAEATGDLTVNSPQAATTLGAVSGTAYYGGQATLSATLTSTSSGQPVADETISFTLDGTSVGTAVTDSSGVATLTGVATTDAVGTDTNGVVANFGGDSNYDSSTGTGNLIVTS